jgi:hypothetical protein
MNNRDFVEIESFLPINRFCGFKQWIVSQGLK